MEKHQVVFLFDVDNTLLDNDRVTADLRSHLEREVGQEGQQEYFRIFEELRSELGYADYLGALQRYRTENPHDPNLLTVSYFLTNYPFANRLFPNSLDAVEHCKQWGPNVILSDGDVVFQPRKVDRSGLLEIFEKNALIYIHKENVQGYGDYQLSSINLPPANNIIEPLNGKSLLNFTQDGNDLILKARVDNLQLEKGVNYDWKAEVRPKDSVLELTAYSEGYSDGYN